MSHNLNSLGYYRSHVVHGFIFSTHRTDASEGMLERYADHSSGRGRDGGRGKDLERELSSMTPWAAMWDMHKHILSAILQTYWHTHTHTHTHTNRTHTDTHTHTKTDRQLHRQTGCLTLTLPNSQARSRGVFLDLFTRQGFDWCWSNISDCRIYRVINTVLHRVTSIHSYIWLSRVTKINRVA